MQGLKEEIHCGKLQPHDWSKRWFDGLKNGRMLTTSIWPKGSIPFQNLGKPVVQQTLSSSPITMDKKMDPEPKTHEAVNFRSLDSGFQAEDISYRMGASFLKSWFKS